MGWLEVEMGMGMDGDATGKEGMGQDGDGMDSEMSAFSLQLRWVILSFFMKRGCCGIKHR